MLKKTMICITCPLGCRLEILQDDSKPVNPQVKGNQCPKGIEYALMELVNPTRVLTSTVMVENAPLSRLPVKTKGAIPKDLILPSMRELDKVIVKGPVKMGEVIIQDLLNSGIDLVATRSLPGL